MSGRGKQIIRVFAILHIFEEARFGITIQQIQDRLNDRGYQVSERTIYRDMDLIQATGFPLVQTGKADNGSAQWAMDRTTKINHYLILTAKEIFSLFMAKGFLTPLKETPFYDDLRSTFQKIEDKLGNQATDYLSELEADVSFEPGPKWGLGLDPDILETIRSACAEGHIIEGVYRSANSQTTRERRLGPQFLYFQKGALYLLAEDLEDGVVKAFSIPRFQSAAMTDTRYTGAPVNADEFFAGSLGVFRGKAVSNVHIRFSPTAAAYVKERQWHHSQRLTNHADGSVLMKLEVAITPELKSWIFGFGPEARVEAPKTLVDDLKAHARELLKVYDDVDRAS